jgi:hypothetical protein
MPTTYTFTFGTDPSRDYTTFAAWDAARARNLFTADAIEYLECYNDSLIDDDFTFSSNWQTTDSCHVRVYAASGHETDGTIGSGVRFTNTTFPLAYNSVVKFEWSQTSNYTADAVQNIAFEGIEFICDNGNGVYLPKYFGFYDYDDKASTRRRWAQFINCLFYAVSNQHVKTGISASDGIGTDSVSDREGLYVVNCRFINLRYGIYVADGYFATTYETVGDLTFKYDWYTDVLARVYNNTWWNCSYATLTDVDYSRLRLRFFNNAVFVDDTEVNPYYAFHVGRSDNSPWGIPYYFIQGNRNAGDQVSDDRLKVPRGVVGNSDYIYVLDAYNYRLVQKEISDTDTFFFMDTYNYGGGDETLYLNGYYNPKGIACDTYWGTVPGESERLVVAEEHHIKPVSLTTLVCSNRYGMVGEQGTPTGVASDIYFDDPHEVDCDPSNPWTFIADTGNNRIKCHESISGGYSQTSFLDHYTTGLSAPEGLCCDGTNIFIADTGNDRIVKLSYSAPPSMFTYVDAIGTLGSGNDQFDNPVSIDCDDTHLYIADEGNNRIVKRLKSDLSYVSQASTYDGTSFTDLANICVHGDYLYITHDVSTIVSLAKSDLSYVYYRGYWAEATDNYIDPKYQLIAGSTGFYYLRSSNGYKKLRCKPSENLKDISNPDDPDLDILDTDAGIHRYSTAQTLANILVEHAAFDFDIHNNTRVNWSAGSDDGAPSYLSTFTADAIVQTTETETLTADTIVQTTETDTFTMDVIISFLATSTLDAIIIAQPEDTFTLDAFIGTTTPGTFTLDAYVVSLDTFTADVWIAEQPSETFTMDTIIRSSTIETFTMDAYISEEVTHTIGTVGRDYTNLTNWESAQQGDLPTTGYRKVAEVYNDSGALITDNCTITGWTTDNGFDIKIIAPATERHNGTAGTGAGFTYGSTDDVIEIGVPYVAIEALELSQTRTPANTYKCIFLVHSAAGWAKISHCLMYGNNNGQYGIYAYVQNAAFIGYFWNNFFYNFGYGMRFFRGAGAGATYYVDNNSIFNSATAAFYLSSSLIVAVLKNNVALDNNFDFPQIGGTWDGDCEYNCSTAGEGDADEAPGSGSLYGKTAANNFDDTGSGTEDLHMKGVDADIYRAGTDLSADSNLDFTDDIDYATRAHWDMGGDFYQPRFDFTMDALIAVRTTDTFTADAIIETTPAGTFTADAYVAIRYTDTFTLDAYVASLDTFTLDAYMFAAIDEPFTADAIIRAIETDTFTTDAILLETKTDANTTIDAIITLPAAVSIGSDPSRDYSTFTAWEAARQRDLTASYASEIVTCYADAAPIQDNGCVIGTAWKTNAMSYIQIEAAAGNAHTGVKQTGFYCVQNDVGTILHLDRVRDVKLFNLGFEVGDNAANRAIKCSGGMLEPGYTIIARCMFWGTAAVTGFGVDFQQAQRLDMLVENCFFHTLQFGVSIAQGSIGRLWCINNTAINCATGFNRVVGILLSNFTFVVKNCVSFCGTPYGGDINDFDITSDYNADNLDDTDPDNRNYLGPGINALHNLTPADELMDITAGSEDLHVMNRFSNLYLAGTSLYFTEARQDIDYPGKAVLRFLEGEWTMGADAAPPPAFYMDGYVAIRYTDTITIDTIIDAEGLDFFSVDAWIAVRYTDTFTADAMIMVRNTDTFTIDVIISASDFSIDTIINTDGMDFFSMDALVAARTTDTATIDAIIDAAGLDFFSIDAYILVRNTKTFVINAEIFDSGGYTGEVIDVDTQAMVLDATAIAYEVKQSSTPDEYTQLNWAREAKFASVMPQSGRAFIKFGYTVTEDAGEEMEMPEDTQETEIPLKSEFVQVKTSSGGPQSQIGFFLPTKYGRRRRK